MRINIYRAYTEDEEYQERSYHEGQTGREWHPELLGWFDYHKAMHWSDADYNGNGSGGTGRGQAIHLTSGGKWVLENWTRWEGEADHYEYITGEQARDWLLRNGEDKAVADHFGDIPEEEDRRPGRPEIGPPVNVRLGTDLLGLVDAYAKRQSVSRAEAIRRLVQDAVTRN